MPLCGLLPLVLTAALAGCAQSGREPEEVPGSLAADREARAVLAAVEQAKQWSVPDWSPPPKPQRRPGDVLIRVRAPKGRVETLSHYYDVRTKNFEKTELVQEKEEFVEFQSQVTGEGEQPENVWNYQLQTMKKNGMLPLADMGFPEPGEKLNMMVSSGGRTIKAGDYPSSSIFFLPTFPFPWDGVRVGETWAYEHQWISHYSGVVLVLEVVGILRELFPCQRGDRCARIELSGDVRPAGKLAGLILQNQIRAETIYALKEGRLLQMRSRTLERAQTATNVTEVQSCMISSARGFLPANSRSCWKEW